MIKDSLAEAESRMAGAVRALEEDLAAVRTGRASPALAEKVLVDYYGNPTPLIQLATISAPEARLLTIRPFDPGSIKEIERAIQASELGLTPSNDGKLIRLIIPPLTEERRHELVKSVRARAEEARVAVRNVRRDVHSDLREFEQEKVVSKDDLRRGEEQLQKVTDGFIDQITQSTERKESEVLEI